MRIAFLALVVPAMLVAGTPAADKPALLLRSINMKKYKGDAEGGDVKKPTVITSEAELAKAIPDKEWQETIKKAVDFSKEEFVFFAWMGPTFDSLSYKVADKENVTFFYKKSAVEKVYSHFDGYALKKGVKFTVEDLKK